MRRPVKKKRTLTPDHVFNSTKVEKLINYVMHDGRKETARRIVYSAFDIIQNKTEEKPLDVFEDALKNVGPTVEVRSRRIGGANYQVPREVRADRRLVLALRWIITAARSKKGRSMDERLADEIIAASKNEGEAVAKRAQVHKMAEANKAFAHFG